MLKQFGLAVIAAGLLMGSTGCACWNHMWGSWAYYGDCNSCGYCDNCPSGPCGGGCGNGGCCGLGVYPPPGSYCGMYDCCESECCDGCCTPNHCGPHHCCWLLKPFQWLHCCDPCGCPHGGCGELYVCDWINNPPTCDPCDCCGNFIGCRDPRPCYQATPRYGSVWPTSYRTGGGPMMDGEVIEEGEGYEEVSPPPANYKPRPSMQNQRAPAPMQAPAPSTQPNNPTFQPQNLPSVRRNTLPSVQRQPSNKYPIR